MRCPRRCRPLGDAARPAYGVRQAWPTLAGQAAAAEAGSD